MEYKAELKDLADAYYGRFRAELRSETASIRTEMANLRADLLKWMFVFWIGNVAATIGIVFAAIKLIRP